MSQGTTPCDDWYTTVQNQLTMCNYKAEIESVLQCDIFLFGLSDQTFISKIISEESPDVTAATIRQKLKKLEAGRATAKYIKGTSTIGKDPTVGVNQVQKQGNPKGKGQKRKVWHKDSHQHSQSHPTKKPFKPNPQQGQPHGQGKNSRNQNLKRPLIQTYVNAVEQKTQTRIQLSCVQVPVQEMSEILTFHQQVPHKTTEHKCEHY